MLAVPFLGNMGSIMTTATPDQTGLDSLHELVSRFEPGDMDVPGGRRVSGWTRARPEPFDALVEGGVARLIPRPIGWRRCAASRGALPCGRRSPATSAPAWPPTAPAASRSARTSTWASASSPRPAATPTRSGFGSSGFAPPTTTWRSSARARALRSSASTAWAAPSLRFCRRSRRSRREGFRVICDGPAGLRRLAQAELGQLRRSLVRAVGDELLDELEIERAHLAGNSMGGRIAIETGLLHPDRVERMVLLSPALAWLRDRGWKWLLRAPLPQLGFIQPAPRRVVEPIVRRLVPGANDGWTAAGVDEFLRSYLTPSGRYAFYESARADLHGRAPRRGRVLAAARTAWRRDTMFVWGKHDQLVPDLIHAPRRGSAARSEARRARLRTRAAGRGARPDPPGDGGVPPRLVRAAENCPLSLPSRSARARRACR